MSDKDLDLPVQFADTADFEQLRMLIEYGHTEDFVCKFYGVSKTAWRKWKSEHPDFELQLRQWKFTADERVERALYARAIGYVHPHEEVKVTKDGFVVRVPTMKHYPPDPTAAIFWLKNRKPAVWKERVELAHEGTVGIAQVPAVEKVEVEDRVKKLIESELTDALQ